MRYGTKIHYYFPLRHIFFIGMLVLSPVVEGGRLVEKILLH
jgi:hypothetical protein